MAPLWCRLIATVAAMEIALSRSRSTIQSRLNPGRSKTATAIWCAVISCCLGLALTLIPGTMRPTLAQQLPTQAPARWLPAPDAKFDLQFRPPMVLDRVVDFMVLDLMDALPDEIQQVHNMGAAAICFFDAGMVDVTDDDFSDFPPLTIGRVVEPRTGPHQERWLDTSNLKALKKPIRARLDLCKSKGFDGVLVANVENNQYRTGFPIGERQQLAYDRWLAFAAHYRGLSIGLWNGRSQIANLARAYDFLILSDCFTDGWCNESAPFIEAGHPAFLVEYAENPRPDVEFCTAASDFKVMGIIKRRVLDGWLRLCPPPKLDKP